MDFYFVANSTISLKYINVIFFQSRWLVEISQRSELLTFSNAVFSVGNSTQRQSPREKELLLLLLFWGNI